MKNYSLSMLLLVAPSILATPTIQKNGSKEEKAFFKKGAEQMTKIVEICNKTTEFDVFQLEKIISDNKTINELNEGLRESPSSSMHQKAFKNYQSYICGMRSIADRYKSHGYGTTQNAVIKAHKKFLDVALRAPDYQTIIAHNKKQLEALNKPLAIARWEILAELP
jgi:hypothetical protein